MNVGDLTVVVCCNKNDFFLARICVASIRYYYPTIAIELIKDEGNGRFNSSELETCFNVRSVDLGHKKLGWGASKFHYLYQQPTGKKVLLLDADIVFIGPFLHRLLPIVEKNDYVVSIQPNDISNKEWVKTTYFDIAEIQQKYPDYQYPGYFFNTGQIFLTVGSIKKTVLDEYFDEMNYPFWKNRELFPLVDQSIYNYLLPKLDKENLLKLGKDDFMVWAGSPEVSGILLPDVEGKNLQRGVIHWAGKVRTGYVTKMLRGDILAFFEDFYYSKVNAGSLYQTVRNIIPMATYFSRKLYHCCKDLKKFSLPQRINVE